MDSTLIKLLAQGKDQPVKRLHLDHDPLPLGRSDGFLPRLVEQLVQLRPQQIPPRRALVVHRRSSDSSREASLHSSGQIGWPSPNGASGAEAMRPRPCACRPHPAAGIEGVTRRKGCASAAGGWWGRFPAHAEGNSAPAPHPCARVIVLPLPPPGWVGQVTSGRHGIRPRLRWPSLPWARLRGRHRPRRPIWWFRSGDVVVLLYAVADRGRGAWREAESKCQHALTGSQ